MAEQLFLKIVNMSISASWLVLAVIILRLLLKKAPKWVNVLLWGIVAIRLISPFSIESRVSLIPESLGNGELLSEWMDDYVGEVSIIHDGSTQFNDALIAGIEPISDGAGGYYVVTKHDQLREPSTVENTVMPVLSIIWTAGMVLMALYTTISYWRLRRRVRTAVRYRDNIFQSENVPSPFVLGIVKPRIYLPFHMTQQDMVHVIAHEQAHIRRCDHWWKPLGFLLLTIHWFNPLMWAAYILLCRDIELACDEKVIKKLGNEQRADYSQALLSCSVHRGMIAACPLAFGEVGVKERVKNVLNYKKPAFWIIVIAVIALTVTAVCFATDPISDVQTDLQNIIYQEGYRITAQEETAFNIMFYKEWLPEDIFTEEGHTFAENEIVVHETATSSMYLSHVGFDDPEQEYLIFTFDFAYELPESGTILLPYQVNLEDGETDSFHFGPALASKDVMDSVTNHTDAAYFRGQGPNEKVCINIRTEVYHAAEDFLELKLSGFNQLSYVPDNGAADVVNSHYRVEEVVYQHPAISMIVTPETAPLYSFSEDFSLMSMNAQTTDAELSGWTQFGTMTYTTLTETNFDDHFEVYDGISDWRNDLSAQQLRRENTNAWYGNLQNNVWDTAFYFLQQKNGDIYLVQARSETGVIQRIYKLARNGPGAVSEEAVAKTYIYGEADSIFRSSFSLYNDGTFILNENPASSYYCHGTYSLTEEELVMKTYDGKYLYYFAVNGDSFVYDETRSSPIHILTEAEKAMQPLPHASVFTLLDEVIIKTVLSLNDVIILSQKGDDLTWSDFESYACEEVGSGMYIYVYEINSAFSLSIGGNSLEEKPIYIRLMANATGDYIDIREENVTAFISAHRNDSTEETAPDSEMIPLESLPDNYSLEQATIDGCVMMINGDIRDNQDVWEEFIDATSAKSEAHVRCVQHQYLADASESFTFIFDIFFDGASYTLRGLLDGEVFERSFRYLLHDSRENEAENPTFDAFSCYHLSNKANSSVLIVDIASDGLNLTTSDQEAYLVYTDLIYYPDHPSIPELEEATLELDGSPLISVIDEDVIQKLEVLLSNAEALGYEPKTHNPGTTLVLSGSTGETISVILDLESDLCQIDGIFYDYGPGYTDVGSINALPELQSLLGLSDWPQAVYEKYADYYAQFTQPIETVPEPNSMFPIEDFLDTGNMIVWYPDWSMVTITGAQPLAVIEALTFVIPEPADTPAPAVEDAVYTLHIAYDSGEEYDVFYVGNDTFYLSVSGTDNVYTFISIGLRETIDNAIEKSE